MIVVKNPELLKQDLTSNGWTMTLVAESLGYSKAYISSIVTGVRNPNEKISIGICELLGKQFERYFFIKTVNKKLTKQPQPDTNIERRELNGRSFIYSKGSGKINKK